MNKNRVATARALMALETTRPGAAARRPTTPTGLLFLAAALFMSACGASAPPAPVGDDGDEGIGRDAAAAVRDSAADRGRANPPPDAPASSPDEGQAAPPDAAAPDLAL